ncbi:MAG: hypothetical protein QOG59_3418 [Solirubrobacteraceae bacterium]|jgi:hypothetical protein|nr:hypothetical protein [Solirubrobacteraceae bacterium]
MSIADATARVTAIQSQISAINGAFTPAAPTAATTTPPTTSASGTQNFASQLAAAQIGAAGSVAATTLPTGATSQLTTAQQQFATRLATDTGLNPGVVSAWLLAEESGSAAQSRQAAGNNDWLNIGYTDSGTYGASATVWNDPTAAADATAGWLKGQNTIPGYGTASAGVQAILSTAGQTPAAQISALQTSGWASSGYPSLPSLYQQVTG